MLESIASVATAIGVAIAAMGIWQGRRTEQLQFELTFTERYRVISDRLPLVTLQSGDLSATEDHEREIFDYMELCEEQMHYRAHNRISSATWADWSIGIQRNLNQGNMHQVCTRLMKKSPHRFDRLAEALGEDEVWDPRPGFFGRIEARIKS